MKKLRSLAVCLFLTLTFCGLAPATANAAPATSLTFDFFHDVLKPYGQWIEAGKYGYCWHPKVADENWRPYADGCWVYSDAGWTWVSYEEFGWITYHYGRWVRLADCGWVWVPGYEWGPAWVSWRYGGDYIGWAPLPSECRFRSEVGISTWVDSAFDIGPANYNFCAIGNFGAQSLNTLILPQNANVALIEATQNVTNITMHGDVVFNGGPDYRIVSGRTGKPVQTCELVRQSDPEEVEAAVASRPVFAYSRGGQLFVTAPPIAPPGPQPFRPGDVAQIYQSPQVDNGWGIVASAALRKHIAARIRSQTEGKPDFAPAHPIEQSQITIIRSTGQRVQPPVNITNNPPPPPPGAPGAPLPPPNQQLQMQADQARHQQMEMERQRRLAAEQQKNASRQQQQQQQQILQQQQAAAAAQARQQRPNAPQPGQPLPPKQFPPGQPPPPGFPPGSPSPPPR